LGTDVEDGPPTGAAEAMAAKQAMAIVTLILSMQGHSIRMSFMVGQAVSPVIAYTKHIYV
jgi:hypothetical protein